jgi:putative Mg2+ transporter-C (MgtC) family protein
MIMLEQIKEIYEILTELNIWSVCFRILLALILGGCIGLERGYHGRAAGLRTHILVCLGATLASMLGFYVTDVLDMGSDPLRVAAQVISGIGFLGVGTILIKGRFQITGLTTSAGLWAVGAIGLALGAGFYEGAIITFVLAMITITLIGKLEGKLNKKYSRFGIYVEIDSDKNVRKIVDFLTSHLTVSDIQVTAPRSGITGNVGIESSVCPSIKNNTMNVKDVTRALEEIEYVVFAIESI